MVTLEKTVLNSKTAGSEKHAVLLVHGMQYVKIKLTEPSNTAGTGLW